MVIYILIECKENKNKLLPVVATETKNLSEVKPEKLNEFTALWKSWKKYQEKSANGADY
ncbi:hypothetical protein [Formosa sp. PL04]|uniref:hypothetical protein n=1 Tax=Formosa sp. PL04 TaxID=3081755 RepID=UPI002980F664|nr:hypothetical protein [Formosa sp. PL04]MDW5289694.1 hypothetical protein [Formosa sp. PL04]